MTSNQASQVGLKSGLHPRNKHRQPYDFDALVTASPELAPFVVLSRQGRQTVDFSDPRAVKQLNRALLTHHYEVEHWDIPAGYLCPPIPGRADYIHRLADLLAEANGGDVPRGRGVQGLDIGVGANCVYPIIGSREYGWRFVGTDIDKVAIESASLIAASNRHLKKLVRCRLQSQTDAMFAGVVKPGEQFDFVVCNPPFHCTAQEAQAGSRQKVRNLRAAQGNAGPARADNATATALNFGGQRHELWCEGGERVFVGRMIEQSAAFANQCLWFSALVSKQENLAALYRDLKRAGVTRSVTVKMAQGQKISRFIAWTYQDQAQQSAWREARWGR